MRKEKKNGVVTGKGKVAWGNRIERSLFLFYLFFFFLASLHGLQILVPQPGIEPMPSAVKVWSPNHWTAREFPRSLFLRGKKLQYFFFKLISFIYFIYFWLRRVLVAACGIFHCGARASL